MKVKNVVICAAGTGSRLGLNIPKCLVPIHEHKLIYYTLQLLKKVKNVYIVVGFKEDEVVQYVKSIRKDVIFVRNPDFNTTSNSYSLALGANAIKDGFLSIDGDIIIDQTNFNLFLEAIDPQDDLLGLTAPKTDDAVLAELDDNGFITRFTRDRIDGLEWSGLAYFGKWKPKPENNYVFEQLISFLPIRYTTINCWEIDTPNDLNRAMNVINSDFFSS